MDGPTNSIQLQLIVCKQAKRYRSVKIMLPIDRASLSCAVSRVPPVVGLGARQTVGERFYMFRDKCVSERSASVRYVFNGSENLYERQSRQSYQIGT